MNIINNNLNIIIKIKKNKKILLFGMNIFPKTLSVSFYLS